MLNSGAKLTAVGPWAVICSRLTLSIVSDCRAGEA